MTAALLIAAVPFLVILREILRDRGTHRSPKTDWVVAQAAGRPEPKPWFAEAREEIEALPEFHKETL